jgi:hypothetical protein
MEKCPPAEACRDAFERMSKATVQMCLSTPGFGFSSEKDAATPRPVKREANASESSGFEYTSKQEYQYTPIAPKPQKKRPPPQFDMDLRGLFPDDLDSNVRPSASFPLQHRRKPHQGMQQFGNTVSAAPSTSQSAASSINSQINTGLGMGQTSIPTLAPSQQYQQSAFNPSSYGSDFMDLSTVPGMDFLNMAIDTGASSTSNAPGNDELPYEIPGMDLGFGVGTAGLDFQHDWSDGQQFDLFDGFFFGSNAFAGGPGTS